MVFEFQLCNAFVEGRNFTCLSLFYKFSLYFYHKIRFFSVKTHFWRIIATIFEVCCRMQRDRRIFYNTWHTPKIILHERCVFTDISADRKSALWIPIHKKWLKNRQKWPFFGHPVEYSTKITPVEYSTGPQNEKFEFFMKFWISQQVTIFQ